MEVKAFSQLTTLTPSQIEHYKEEIGEEELMDEIESCKEILNNIEE